MQITKVHINKFRTLENLTINFERSLPQVFPIVGDNGAGKTSLLELIYALFYGQFKTVHYELAALYKEGKVIAAVDVMVSQNKTLNFMFTMGKNKIKSNIDTTVIKNNLYYIEHHNFSGEYLINCDRAYTFEFLNKTMLPYLEDSLFNYLSKGGLKYACLLEFIDYKPGCVFLIDEIECSLDCDAQYNIVQELIDSKNQFLLATHSLELCRALVPSNIKLIGD